jgi:hypothetical protein
MFDEIGQPERTPMPRFLWLSLYGVYCALGAVASIQIMRKFGLSHPVQLAIWVAMFLLSLWWFIAGARSVNLPARRYAARNCILMGLFLAGQLIKDAIR